MKKIFALALAVMLLLSLAGCGGRSSGEFDYIVELLEHGEYEEAKAAIDELQGIPAEEPTEEAMEAAGMETTAPMEAEPMPEPEPVATTAPAPIRATTKLLSELPITKVDNLGNESKDNYYFYQYDEYGRIVKIGGHELGVPYGFYLHTFADYLKIDYAPDGKVESFKEVDSWDDVHTLGTPTYDENGNMVSIHVQTNTKEFTLKFAYDDNGRCTRADVFDTFWEDIAFDVKYSYDDAGRLIKEVWDCVGFGNTGRTYVYAYDEEGRLIQSTNTTHEKKPTCETTLYTYDADGDLAQAVTTSDNVESGYKTKTTNFVYSYLEILP